MTITPQDQADMRAWLESVGLAPTPILVDALIQLFRRMEETHETREHYQRATPHDQ